MTAYKKSHDVALSIQNHFPNEQDRSQVNEALRFSVSDYHTVPYSNQT